MCIELEAANAKGNSRQLFRIVKSMTRKFQPRLQCIRSATGKNLTEAAQIADRWKGYCEDLYHDDEGKGTEQEYWEQEPPPLRSDVARAIRQTASHKATGPDEVPAELFATPSLDGNIKTWTRFPAEELVRMTEDRDKGESTPMVWLTLGSRTAKEQNKQSRTL